MDQSRLEELYGTHRRSLVNYINRVLQDWSAAEDITQDCFLNLIAYMNKYPLDDKNLKSFLFKTAHNLCLNYIKKNKRIHFITLNESENNPYFVAIQSNIDNNSLSDFIAPFIAHFDTSHREIFVMKLIDNMTAIEIAKKIGISERTVRRKIMTVLAFLTSHYSFHDFSSLL